MPEKPEAVDRLAVTGEHTTTVLEQLANGKIHVASKVWLDLVIVCPNRAHEARFIDRHRMALDGARL